jgi:hypothetical protein
VHPLLRHANYLIISLQTKNYETTIGAVLEIVDIMCELLLAGIER